MWEFVKSSTNRQNWLEGHAKEVCFIGRSNVGKSSLINAITRNSKLARVSNTPGRTRQINFFKKEDHFLVDLPGYGYARMSQVEKSKMITMVEEYFRMRMQISTVFVLIDTKVGPTKDDLLMLDFLNDCHHKVIIVATKSDKATRKELEITIKKMQETHHDFLITSCKSGQNIAMLKKIVGAQF